MRWSGSQWNNCKKKASLVSVAKGKKKKKRSGTGRSQKRNRALCVWAFVSMGLDYDLLWLSPKLIRCRCIHLYAVPHLVTVIHFGLYNFHKSPFVIDDVDAFELCRSIMP